MSVSWSRSLLVAFGLAVASVPAAAQQPVAPAPPAAPASSGADVQQVRDELDRLKREFDVIRQQYDQRLLALEQRLTQIGAGPLDAATSATAVSLAPAPAATPQEPSSPPPPPADQASTPAPAGSSKVFNPDMSVIGNFVGVAGKNPYSTQKTMQLTEAEAAFQAVVDPYAKADFFLSASPEGLEVEEGYVTFTALPAGLLLKVGKLRANFGKVNTLHTHAMPTADRPLVTENLVGGEEGLSDAGMSLSHLVQSSKMYLELTGEVYTGDSAVFQSQARSQLNYVGRVRAYHDLTEATNIDVGTSYALGPTDPAAVGQPMFTASGDPASLHKQLFGIDATFRYRPLRRAIYQRLNLRTELIWSRQDLSLTASDHTTAFGYYGLAEYQFARRWYVGGRYDRSGRALDGSLIDHGASAFMTFWPTEFSQIRGQYRFINFAEGVKANEFLFQFNFAIGAHGAHMF
jgi:hypothetical protein